MNVSLDILLFRDREEAAAVGGGGGGAWRKAGTDEASSWRDAGRGERREEPVRGERREEAVRGERREIDRRDDRESRATPREQEEGKTCLGLKVG